jgi:hypothetical protein
MTALRPFWLIPLAALSVGCNDPPTAPEPAKLVLVQAPSLVGVPGWQLIDTLKVQAVDAGGRPRRGVAVQWAVREGGGSVEVLNDTTGADGFAQALWTLGDRAGTNSLKVSTADDAVIDFQATGGAFQVDRLAASGGLGCGLVGGALWCWGRGAWVRTAPASLFPTVPDPPGWSSGPGVVDSVHGFTEVAVSSEIVCALDGQSAVWCARASAPQVALVAGLPPMRQIVGASTGWVVGGAFCGLALSDSTQWCWQLGGTPVQVPGPGGFTGIWMGGTWSPTLPVTVCGLLVDSTAACWGAGPLGDGLSDSSSTPVTVSGGHRFAQLAVGTQFACGREPTGEVWCWGKNQGGGGLPDVTVPALTTTGAAQLAADGDGMELLGPLTRWTGANFSNVVYPTGLTGLPVTEFARNNYSCARLVDGQVYCVDEMWNPGWSFIADMNYSPVQPVRTLPPDAGAN